MLNAETGLETLIFNYPQNSFELDAFGFSNCSQIGCTGVQHVLPGFSNCAQIGCTGLRHVLPGDPGEEKESLTILRIHSDGLN